MFLLKMVIFNVSPVALNKSFNKHLLLVLLEGSRLIQNNVSNFCVCSNLNSINFLLLKYGGNWQKWWLHLKCKLFKMYVLCTSSVSRWLSHKIQNIEIWMCDQHTLLYLAYSRYQVFLVIIFTSPIWDTCAYIFHLLWSNHFYHFQNVIIVILVTIMKWESTVHNFILPKLKKWSWIFAELILTVLFDFSTSTF